LRAKELPPTPAITPHSLRHTYCSLQIAQGEDLATVADHMRHADQSTTLKI
jgi:integrase